MQKLHEPKFQHAACFTKKKKCKTSFKSKKQHKTSFTKKKNMTLQRVSRRKNERIIIFVKIKATYIKLHEQSKTNIHKFQSKKEKEKKMQHATNFE